LPVAVKHRENPKKENWCDGVSSGMQQALACSVFQVEAPPLAYNTF
jgi:hypothetical protein